MFQAHKPQLRQSNHDRIDRSKEHNVISHRQVLSKTFILHCHTISYQCVSIIADCSNTGQQKHHICYLLSSLRRQHHHSTSLTTTDPSLRLRLHNGSSRLLALADPVEIVRTIGASGVIPTLLWFCWVSSAEAEAGAAGAPAAGADAHWQPADPPTRAHWQTAQPEAAPARGKSGKARA